MIDVGIRELNRNPENYFADAEMAAFSPSNIVPGDIVERQLGHFAKVNPDYAAGVRAALAEPAK